MKNWIRLGILSLIPIICVICITAIGDSSNLFHPKVYEDLASSILEGNQTYITSTLNGRSTKKALVEKMPDFVDTIVVGPSLSLCIDEELAGTDSFYNLSVEAANYYDILAFFGLMEVNNKKYNRVIFSADFDFFNEGRTATSLTTVFSPYYNYMLSLIKNEGKSFDNTEYAKNISKQNKGNLKHLLSLRYCQDSAKVLYQFIRYKAGRIGIVTEENKGRYFSYNGDGSFVYQDRLTNIPERVITNMCITYEWDVYCQKNEHISEESEKTFMHLIDYLHQKGIKTDIFVCPLPPTLYNLFDKNARPLLQESEDFLKEYCTKYGSEKGVRLIGSYSPLEYGLTDADFYDARHLRREKLSVFDFTSPY